jgi:hypothetical protein
LNVTIAAPATLADALNAIAGEAPALDAAPEFPHAAFARLRRAGALVPPATRGEEWALVRAVAKADGSVGRLLEGHLNACERLELEGIDAGDQLLGVWGAPPGPGEGEPAYIAGDGTLHGTKVFCSGAGGLDGALVTASGELVNVDLADHVEIDRDWFRAGGMRASESHRVTFHGAPIRARLRELTTEPYFSGDAIRTAAAWAGIADAAAGAALAAIGPDADDLRAHAAGRIITARATIDRWFEHAALARDLEEISVPLRVAVADAGAAILEHAARACGTRPFAAGGVLDRARRDFELFVLQHRLDPMLARLGRSR